MLLNRRALPPGDFLGISPVNREVTSVIGWQELLIIMVIVMLVFGTSRISGIGKAMGTAIRDFKESMKSEPEKPKSVETPKVERSGEETPKETGQIK
jgi:sec-independent protein translocase protein TatA